MTVTLVWFVVQVVQQNESQTCPSLVVQWQCIALAAIPHLKHTRIYQSYFSKQVRRLKVSR